MATLAILRKIKLKNASLTNSNINAAYTWKVGKVCILC